MSSSKRPPAASPSSKPTRAILVAVVDPSIDERAAQRSQDELCALVDGLGIVVVERIVQRRAVGPSMTYLGQGKLKELAAKTGGPGEVVRGPEPQGPVPLVDDDLVVVVDDELSPQIERALTLALGVEVLDRTRVILRVFEARARTREAMLEIEIARRSHELPRIRDDHSRGDREGGGGRASRGHSNVELAKQRERIRIAALRREADEIDARGQERRADRGEHFTVALVGYTNAGKSSLMRALTGSDVFIENKLFATLGTTVRQLSPPSVPPVLVVDTVGLIDRLPHALVASFRSTLREASGASLLLIVADASDTHVSAQLAVTARVLEEIGAGHIPSLVVLNKADLLDDETRCARIAQVPNAWLMSAHRPDDVAALRLRIEAKLADELVSETLTLPYSALKWVHEVRERVQIVSQVYDDDVTLTVRGRQSDLTRLRARLSREHAA